MYSLTACQSHLSQQVVVYLPDTIRRKRLEKETLVGGVELSHKQLKIESLQPNGVSKVATYELPAPSIYKMSITSEGVASIEIDSAALKRQARIERWRRIGNWALFGSFFVGGVLVGSEVVE